MQIDSPYSIGTSSLPSILRASARRPEMSAKCQTQTPAQFCRDGTAIRGSCVSRATPPRRLQDWALAMRPVLEGGLVRQGRDDRTLAENAKIAVDCNPKAGASQRWKVGPEIFVQCS